LHTTKPSTTTTHPLERFLAIVGAVVCLIITIPIWWGVSAQQTMWPLPGLYFIEMVALSVVSALAFIRGDSRSKLITWGAVGIFSAFSIVGAWSVGFFYLPVAFIFGVIAIISEVRNKQLIAAHFGVCIIAGIAQAVLMFTAIRLLYPSAVF
jgi:hypothetical protein